MFSVLKVSYPLVDFKIPACFEEVFKPTLDVYWKNISLDFSAHFRVTLGRGRHA